MLSEIILFLRVTQYMFSDREYALYLLIENKQKIQETDVGYQVLIVTHTIL